MKPNDLILHSSAYAKIKVESRNKQILFYEVNMFILLAGVTASEALRNGLCQSLWGASASRQEPRIASPPPQSHETPYPVRGEDIIMILFRNLLKLRSCLPPPCNGVISLILNYPNRLYGYVF